MQELSTTKFHGVPSRCAPADGTPLKTASVCPADSLRIMLHRLVARGRTDVAHWHGKSEQSRRRESRSVPERTQLRPHHIRSDTPPPRRGVEAAIARGEHGGSVSDHSNDPFDSIRDHLRVFDDVGQRVDDASHQHLPGLQRKLLKAAEFMRVTRAGEGQIQSPDVRLLNDWQDILKRYVAVMGTFRVAPTHVQAHTV